MIDTFPRNRQAEGIPGLVSVIVPAFNARHFVVPCIHSILNQTYKNIEVIFVDDGSTDDTMDVVQRFKDPRIRCITQKNAGVSVARNKGIAESRGRWVAFCDVDDSWHPQKLSLQLERAQEDGLQAVYAWGRGVENGKVVFEMGHTKRWRPTLDHLFFEDHIAVSSLLVDGLYARTHPFREDLLYCEDYEWKFWMIEALKVGCVSTVPLVFFNVSCMSRGVSPKHYEYEIQVLREFVSRHPRFQSRLRSRLGMLDYRQGKVFIAKRNWKLSRRYFLRAIFRHPWYFKSYMGLIYALLSWFAPVWKMIGSKFFGMFMSFDRMES